MATSGLTTLGGRTIIYGGATGIDTSALITASYNAKKSGSDSLQTKISANTSKVAAYSELQSLSQAVQSSIAGLKKSYSSLGSTSSFDSRTGVLSSSNVAVSPTGLIDVAIDPGTILGSHTISVQQKAQVQRVSSYGQANPSAAMGYTGNFSINVQGKTPSAISVTSGMTLYDLATAINATTANSGVTATVAKVTETNYEFILTGTDTNKQILTSGVSGTNVLKNIGVIDGGGTLKFVLQNYQPSILNMDGTTYTRDGTKFEDLISGLDVNVKNADTSVSLQLDINSDTTAVEDAVGNFVTSYNALRDYILKNQQVQNGAVSKDALLFSDTALKSLSKDVQALLGASYGSNTATYRTLRDLGVTMDGNGRLQQTTTTLQDALRNKFSEVRALFETTVTSDNTNFRMIANTSRTTSLTAAMNITYSGGAITGVSVGGDSSLFDVSGSLITGKSGTSYEGMSFAYVGTSNATINLSMKQGFADLLNSSVEKYSSITSGEIQKRKMELDTLNTKMQTRSTEILARADDYRLKLIDKYANYEQKIARSKSVLAQIQAALNVKN